MRFNQRCGSDNKESRPAVAACVVVEFFLSKSTRPTVLAYLAVVSIGSRHFCRLGRREVIVFPQLHTAQKLSRIRSSSNTVL